jgi:hypothetical protein
MFTIPETNAFGFNFTADGIASSVTFDLNKFKISFPTEVVSIAVNPASAGGFFNASGQLVSVTGSSLSGGKLVVTFSGPPSNPPAGGGTNYTLSFDVIIQTE